VAFKCFLITWSQWLTEINGVDILVNDKQKPEAERDYLPAQRDITVRQLLRDEINNHCHMSGVRTCVPMQQTIMLRSFSYLNLKRIKRKQYKMFYFTKVFVRPRHRAYLDNSCAGKDEMSRFCKLIAYVTVRHFVALE
jgi:hypothetical protein